MKHAQAPLSTKMFPWLAALLVVTTGAGCGSLTQRVSSLEDDELYLERNEEYLTDAEYLAYAYEQAGYGSQDPDFRDGDEFESPFGYVPQSLRGRSMLRGYMTPYGAGGFGLNPYDPYASSFYGGFNPYSPYSMGAGFGGGAWGNTWAMNPYGMNGFGNPYGGWNSYGYNPYGYNPYGGWNSFGYNPYGSWNTMGGPSSGDAYNGGFVVMGSRTPIWSSSSVNSNGSGGRLITNRTEEAEGEEVWTIWKAGPTRTSSSVVSGASRSTQPARTNATSSRGASSTRTNSAWDNSTRSNATRSSSWSNSSSGSSRGSSSTRSNGSTGSSRGTSSGRGSSRSGGRQ